MTSVTHLRALQALELALREGSLTAAAALLGITPAAVGQRIRALEEYLGTDLLLRGRSGLTPTAELSDAMDDLKAAFAALERVTEALDFRRVSEIHIVADSDLADLWLGPRLAGFRARYPGILFCVNGQGDVPLRLGAPDLRITYGPGSGDALFRETFVPITGPDNVRRIAGYDAALKMEGMPLLHLNAQRDSPDRPGWVTWFRSFGYREEGMGRGVHYGRAQLALDAVKTNVGFMICGLALILRELAEGTVVCPFPAAQHLDAPHPYRLSLRSDSERRPQVQRFVAWLRAEAAETERQMQEMLRPA